MLLGIKGIAQYIIRPLYKKFNGESFNFKKDYKVINQIKNRFERYYSDPYKIG